MPPYFRATTNIAKGDELLTDYQWDNNFRLKRGLETQAKDGGTKRQKTTATPARKSAASAASKGDGRTAFYDHTTTTSVVTMTPELKLEEWKREHPPDEELGHMVALARDIYSRLERVASKNKLEQNEAGNRARNKASMAVGEFYPPSKPFSTMDPDLQSKLRVRYKEMAEKAHQSLHKFREALPKTAEVPDLVDVLIKELHNESAEYATKLAPVTVASKLKLIEGMDEDAIVTSVVTLTSAFDLKKADLEDLASKKWLNDMIINAMLALFCSRPDADAIALSSFFFNDYEKGGYEKVRGWTHKKMPHGIFSKDMVLIPANMNGNHWVLFVIDNTTRSIEIYDSMVSIAEKSDYDKYINFLLDFIKNEQENHNLPFEYWDAVVMKSPQQNNGYDCGVFTIGMASTLVYSETFLDLEGGDSDENRSRIYDALLDAGKSPFAQERRERAAAAVADDRDSDDGLEIVEPDASDEKSSVVDDPESTSSLSFQPADSGDFFDHTDADSPPKKRPRSVTESPAAFEDVGVVRAGSQVYEVPGDMIDPLTGNFKR